MPSIENVTPIYLERWVVEQLMFGSGRVRRFTQDTPVLPDVWIEYAIDPSKRQDELTKRPEGVTHPPLDLLLTPFRDLAAGTVRKAVRHRVEEERKDKEAHLSPRDSKPPKVIYHQSTVMATLYFEDLVRAVIPMTDWWRRLTKQFRIENLQNPDVQAALAHAVIDPEHPPKIDGAYLPSDVLWMIRVVGAIALCHRNVPLDPVFTDKDKGPGKATEEHWLPLVKAVAKLMASVDPPSPQEAAQIHSIALNRIARPTVSGSRLAVKADSAKLLFNISCRDIRWAVIDSGIDATHPAFRKKLSDDERVEGRGYFSEHGSRVRATYDFSQIHELLDADDDTLTVHLEKVVEKNPEQKEQWLDEIKQLNQWLKAGRSIDWGVLEPLLRIRHDENYETQHIPSLDHGTHVAGILGGNWIQNDDGTDREEKLIGVCDDIEMYDLRILDKNGDGDEFTVMAALQFVRWLNATNDFMAVHGVNMSLSIPHDVANYACGRTPVCDEAERVVSSGIVVVVAAGNQGYRISTDGGVTMPMYNTISITDPGNADMVITVGATHRARPHTYGVSYFSSRGPTGDGRLKPDLVAPGEKITAPLPRGMYGLKDGTSMAAPHVSGAAAMLMARHNELVGRPQRIKQILCSTATDLGRERYFQGAGMLDILRAMQSV